MVANATKWVKFTQEYIQKAEGEDDKTFKKNDIIEVEEAVAKSLVDVGMAEETKAPELSVDFTKSLESLQTTVTDVVEKTLKKSMEDATSRIKETIPNYAVAKGENYDLEKEYGFKDEGHFFKAVHAGSAKTPDLNFPGIEFLTKAPTGHNINTDVEGGFAVPEPMLDRIWDNIDNDPTNLLGRTDRYTTAGNSLKIPRAFEASRKSGAGNRYAGIETTWLDEADEIQATKAKIGRMNLELHKLGAVTYFTDEMLEDQGFDFRGWVNRRVPQAINFAITEAIVEGSGVGKPKGFLKEDALIVVPLEAGQGNHTIFHSNLSNIYWRNWNRASSVWLVHPDAAQKLEFTYFNDDESTQRPVYLPSNQIVDSPFSVLYGRPVIPFEFMPDFGSQGDIGLYDLSQYATLTKAGGGIKTASSIHVRFLFEETAFRFTTRIDGRSLWTSPKEDLKGDTTRSPFVTMAARTGGSTSSGL